MFNALIEAANDGLRPNGKEAFLIPRWDKKNKVHVCCYQPTAAGYVRRLREEGVVLHLIAVAVHADDEYWEEPTKGKLHHRVRGFDRGAWIGTYAYAELPAITDRNLGDVAAALDRLREEHSAKRIVGRLAQIRKDVAKLGGGSIRRVWEALPVEEIDKIRKQADASAKREGGSPAWNIFTAEMSKKTAIRRLAKYQFQLTPRTEALMTREDDLYDWDDEPRGAIAGSKTVQGQLDAFAGAGPQKQLPAPQEAQA